MNRTLRYRITGALILSLALAGCGGGGGGGGGPSTPPTTPPGQDPPPSIPRLPDPSTAPPLKEVFPDLRIGAAIEPEQLEDPRDRALLLKHYNSVTPENAMKADTIAPADISVEPPNFERADAIVEFARANDMRVHGHTLVWHTTTPKWFWNRPPGMSDADYRATVEQRLRDYVRTVVSYFSGRVEAWDVVNEVASDNPGEVYRKSQWFQAFSIGGGEGQEYIRIAFEEARAADPEARLFINDYGTENPEKLAKIRQIIDYIEATRKDLVDGVGHQFHLQRTSRPEDVDAALATVASWNKANRVTELDVSIYDDPGDCFVQQRIPPCRANYGPDLASVPQSVVSAHARLYRELFEVFRAHSLAQALEAVTTWGMHDAHTWLNSWPVARTNHPLLFDRDRNPKLTFWAVADSDFAIP